MARIYVDSKLHEVNAEQNLLHACLSLGYDLPYFCWHPALGSVGACRQCAVKQFKDENDTRGRIVMACMTPATEGARISIRDPEAAAFRAGVIEGLMLSHPHDCPVCDEGGECHLQDMTVMTGHSYRRYPYEKRTFRNQYLGPLVYHEMNRCIQCYRCVRFYREYAGGKDLNAFGLRNIVYFGREKDGVLESEFAGNLIEVCPTGVFTDNTLRHHYTRKWDLRMAPSVCAHCSLGCNTSPGERYGTLRRIVNRYNHDVNGYFLCDRGRFGYEFANSDRRLRHPLRRRNGNWEAVTKEEALAHLGALLAEPQKVIGIGSPRASLEANFALRQLVGPQRFFLGISDVEHGLGATMIRILRQGPARSPSLREVELSDAVFVLGEDVPNTAPRMALSLRQAVRQQPMRQAAKLKIPLWQDHAVRELVQDEKGPLFLATPNATRLDEIAAQTYRAAPDDLARLGFAVAQELDSSAPPVPNLSKELRALAESIARTLKEAERPLIVSGASANSQAVIQAAANVAWALCRMGRPAGLSFVFPECNSAGLAMLGGRPLSEAFRAVPDGEAKTVIVLENDLYRRAGVKSVNDFLGAAEHVVLLDHLAHETGAKAELVLPVGTLAEADGTLVSNEGRAQRHFQVFLPEGEIQESWRWLADALAAGGQPERAWKTLDQIIEALARNLPVFSRVPQAAPGSRFRLAEERIPRAPHRYSGRTAMLAHIDVHEPTPPEDPDSPLSFSMEGYPGVPPGSTTPFFWAPGWNSIQSVNKFQEEVGGPLRGGPSGVRLVEAARESQVAYFTGVPAAFKPRAGEWLLVPIYHVFGSEELSRWAPGVAELSPQPYVALNPDDAAKVSAQPGREIELAVNGITRYLVVKIAAELPRGVAGLPAGIPPVEGLVLPAWGRIGQRR